MTAPVVKKVGTYSATSHKVKKVATFVALVTNRMMPKLSQIRLASKARRAGIVTSS